MQFLLNMDSKTIEKIAVLTVSESIIDTDILHPYVNDDDKEPSWDGNIYVYEDKNKKKSSIDGRVPVQVKGKLSSNLSKKGISYPAEVADLKNYLSDFGVIYFVVLIDRSDQNKRKIYYATLPPIKLKQLLKEANGQAKKTITLKEFPLDRNERASIVIHFLEQRKRQASFIKSEPISMEDLQGKNVHFTIPIKGYGQKPQDLLLSPLYHGELYVYAQVEGSNIPTPINSTFAIVGTQDEVKEKIMVNGICYYDTFQRIYSSENISIKIGNSTTLYFNRNSTADKVNVNVKIQFSPFLQERIKDMQFVINAVKAKHLQIGSVNLDMGTIAPNLDINALEKTLAYQYKIKELLDILHVEEDLNLDGLSNEQQKHVDTLVKSIVDKEPIKNIAMADTSTLDLKISNLYLKLILHKDSNGYSIYDYFNSNLIISYKDNNEQHKITSPYAFLNKSDYLRVSNINYKAMLPSYRALVKHDENIFELANMSALQMLLAYDKNLNPILLDTAKSICLWIAEEGKHINKQTDILNNLQIIKRERELNRNEKVQLIEICEDADATEFEKVGAHLLLDNQISAEIHFNRLSEIDQENFKTYPIFKFWNPSIK